VLDALLIALVVVAALGCPVMMWLGRRGIGPGCALMGCKPKRDEETIESLREQQRDLAQRIAKAEGGRKAGSLSAADRR
jgi:hypothetical protein